MFLLIIIHVLLVISVISKIQVDPGTGHFVDQWGRVRVFHGVNAVYKQAPWLPDAAGFDPRTSLSALDAKNLSAWGFNVVRLGVMWPGWQPQPGANSAEYAAMVRRTVALLAAEGVYTLADMHQDLLSRKFCGEGAPDWAVRYPHHPQVLRFPLPAAPALPVVNGTPGYPPLADCLQHEFARYYLAEAVGASFQDLYDNENGMQDHLVAFWGNVSAALGGDEFVLGYELINEPWPGNIYANPGLALPGEADRMNLAPMYAALVERIRAHDPATLVFFEKALFPGQLAPSGLVDVPGGPAQRNRSVLSYHVYCGSPNRQAAVCDLENMAEFVVDVAKDARRLGGGAMMTEFGAVNGTAAALDAVRFLLALADTRFQSWAYWQFKYFHDLTTADGPSESFYDAAGRLQRAKLATLSRTYAQAIAGQPVTTDFNPDTAAFSLQFAAADPAHCSQPTEVYLNEPLHYPSGFAVSVFPHQALTWSQPAPNKLHFSFSTSVIKNQLITIKIQRK